MNKQQKQDIINSVTEEFRRKQWFNGCGFTGDILIVAYNYYPAFEMVDFKNTMLKYGVEHQLKDIREVMPGSQKDDLPSHMR